MDPGHGLRAVNGADAVLGVLRREPTRSWVVPLPRAWTHFQRPVLAEGLVFVAGRRKVPHPKDLGKASPAPGLVALDASTGELRWQRILEGDDVGAASPRLLRDGMLLVVSHDRRGIRVGAVNPRDGREQSASELPEAAALPVWQRLISPPCETPEGNWLVSWLVRGTSEREEQRVLSCRTPSGEVAWEVPERMIAATRTMVFGEGAQAPSLAVRRQSDGSLAWELDLEDESSHHRTVLSIGSDGILVRSQSSARTVKCLEPETGAVRWSVDLEHPVHAALWGRHACAVVAFDSGRSPPSSVREGRLVNEKPPVRLDHRHRRTVRIATSDGRVLGASARDGEEAELPTGVVAIDPVLLIWSSCPAGRELLLHCEPLMDPSTEAWRLPLGRVEVEDVVAENRALVVLDRAQHEISLFVEG